MTTMDHTDPIFELAHSVVRLDCQDSQGRHVVGTGYFFEFCVNEDGDAYVPCIVTNKHVVENAVKGSFTLTLRNVDGSPDIGKNEVVEVSPLQRWVIRHPSDTVDLVAIPIAPILEQAAAAKKAYFFILLRKQDVADSALLDSLSPMEDIVMLGYPDGLWDAKHNMPIIRRGITATHPKLPWNGRPEFVIDAACMNGSSGSPVFLANFGSFRTGKGLAVGDRVALLGTLWGGPELTRTGKIVTVPVTTVTEAISVGTIPMNLGFVIQVEELFRLEETVRALAVGKSNLPALAPKPSRTSPCPCSSGKRYKECCGKL